MQALNSPETEFVQTTKDVAQSGHPAYHISTGAFLTPRWVGQQFNLGRRHTEEETNRNYDDQRKRYKCRHVRELYESSLPMVRPLTLLACPDIGT